MHIIDGNKVCAFADFQRTDGVIQSQCLCAFDGSHTECAPCRKYLRIGVFNLVEQSNRFHFADNVVAVIARCLIRTKGHLSSCFLECS